MRKLGEILLEEGLLSMDQLESALRRQSRSGGRLGTNLVEMMLMDDISLGQVLARQMGVPAVHPQVLEKIGNEVLGTIPANLVEHYKALPFKVEGRRLHVAMLDPSNIDLVDELSHRSGYIIKAYLCSESVLYRALSIHYQIPPPIRRTVDDIEASMENVIVHDTSGLVSLDDDGQFTLVDRADILGMNTKKLFLDASSKTEVIGFFLQFLSYNCDKLAFLAYDNNKNYLWRDSHEFKKGKTGMVCGNQINKSKFWNRYLSKPGFFYTRLSNQGSEMNWVKPMLDLDHVKALFLAPIQTSRKVLGVAIGGSTTAMRLEEELDTIKKLHLITISALKIQEFKKIIINME